MWHLITLSTSSAWSNLESSLFVLSSLFSSLQIFSCISWLFAHRLVRISLVCYWYPKHKCPQHIWMLTIVAQVWVRKKERKESFNHFVPLSEPKCRMVQNAPVVKSWVISIPIIGTTKLHNVHMFSYVLFCFLRNCFWQYFYQFKSYETNSNRTIIWHFQCLQKIECIPEENKTK